jgi:hypothetical protein
MDTNGIGKYTRSFALSLAITSVVSALLVVWKESNETLLAFMKSITGHHWITHSIFDLILFVIIGLILARSHGGEGVRMTGTRLITVLVCAVVLGGLIISGFYLIGD